MIDITDNKHYCIGCLTDVVGPRVADVLIRKAEEDELPERHYWLILRGAEAGRGRPAES